MKKLAVLFTFLFLFLVCNIAIVNNVHAEYNYVESFESFAVGTTSGEGDILRFNIENGSIQSDVTHNGSRAIGMTTDEIEYVCNATLTFQSVQIREVAFYFRRTDYSDTYIYFYSGNDIFLTLHVKDNAYVYWNDTKLNGDAYPGFVHFRIVHNTSAHGYDVVLDGDKTTIAGDRYFENLILDKIIFEMRSTSTNHDATVNIDDIELAVIETGELPDYSNIWLHFGNVDTSAFYSIKNYKYCEAKRNIPMSIIVKRIEIAFDENQNLTSINNLELYFSGNDLGHPDSITKYHATYNDVYLAEWTDLNLYLNDTYPVIELRSNKQENGYYWKGLGVFSRDIDNDGQKNTYFHSMDGVYGNGQAEGSTNILYDLAYRVWYVLQGYEVEDTVVAQKDTVQYYDTLAISYIANIEETTYLLIYNASDDEVYNTTLKSIQGKVFFTPTEDMGTGTYTVKLVRNGTAVANDTFNVVEGNTQYAVWVDKSSILPNEQFTIYYRLPENEYGQIEILRGSTVVYSIDVEGSTNIQTLTYSNDNAGIYTIKLYRNVNGTLYLKDDEVVTIGEGYYINTVNVNRTQLNVNEYVKIYGTHQYAGYNVYVLIQPGGLIYDVSNSNTFEIDYKATQIADYNVYLMLDNKVLDTTGFTVAPAGTFYENPLVSNFKYIIAVVIIIIFTILGVAISNKANITSSHKWFVTAIFTLVATFICVIYSLIPLWVPFLFALILTAYIIREVL